MKCFLFVFGVFLSICASSACIAQWSGSEGDEGFLNRPPVYINNEPDFPLTGLGVLMPEPGVILPDIDLSGVSSDHWFQNGHNVQPGLDLEVNWIRVGALRGFKGGWAAGLSIPYYRNKIRGNIGGYPATSIAQGFGNIELGGKKLIWQDKCKTQRIIVAGAIELPTGKDDAIFGQSNLATDGYYAGNTQRVPLGWQPSTGTWNGLLAASYGRSYKRLSWEFLLAGKINGIGDEDVHVGNVFISALAGTYGITKSLAGTLGLTLRAQSDDDYPNSPISVNQFPLTATTSHSSLLYLDAGIRYGVMERAVIGIAIRTPINQPDEGMQPTSQVSYIFYPNM